MTAHYHDPGLEPQNRPFALLYLRTTEGMRDANAAGPAALGSSDRPIVVRRQRGLDAHRAGTR
jgi:hypothetical protein